MRRTIPYLFALLLFPFTLWGQVSVSADPTSFVLNGQPGELDIAYHISITNTSNQAGQIYWSIRMTNNPNNWLTWICDKNLCYTPDITSCPGSKPNVLAAGETIDFQVHMNPQNTEGTANYEIKILDDAGSTLLTIPGEILISQASSSKDVANGGLSVFPNPTSDYFRVSETPGLKMIEVYNIVGSKVRTFDAWPDKQYHVADLNEGIYLVRLISANGKVIKTVRLSKR